MNLEAKTSIIQRGAGHLVKQIRQGLWQIVFHFPATTNCWLLQEADGLTLVDAGHPWNAGQILQALRYIALPLRCIVITHAHPDHAGAAAELAKTTGASVYVHELDLPYLQGQASLADLSGHLPCRAILNAGRWLGILHPPPVEKVQPVYDGERLGSLEVLHTPGHTPGSISLWCREEGAIFCGDNLFGIAPGVLRYGLPWFTLDIPTRNACVERYAKLGASLLLSGHGPVYERSCLPDELSNLTSSIGRPV